MLSERAQKKADEEWLKEKEQLRERVDELWHKRNDITPLDMKRVTMLYLILMGCDDGMDAEKLDAEMQKVRKTFEIVKENLNN